MAEEKLSVAEVLQEVLQQDRTLLARKDDLLEALNEHRGEINGAQMKDFRSLQKALRESNIGDLFAAVDDRTDEDKEIAKEEAKQAAEKKLREGNTQEQTIQKVIGILVDALEWDKEPKPQVNLAKDEPVVTDPVTEAIENTVNAGAWDCVCGHKANQGVFCVACGRPRSVGEAKAQEDVLQTNADAGNRSWDCICGHKGNTGKFCVDCGRLRSVGEQKQTQAQSFVQEETQVLPKAAPIYSQAQSEQMFADPQLQTHPTMTGSTQQPPAGNASDKKKRNILIGVIAILVIVIGVMAFKGMSKDTTAPTNTQQVAQQADNDEPTKVQRTMESDLSLGGLDLDCPVKDMTNLYGKEDEAKTVNGLIHHYYHGKIEVVTDDDVVSALVSDGSDVKTKRGLHEGSTLSDVQSAYGTDYTKSDYDDTTLYEYTFSSMDGNKGILRFAVKKSDNTVKYISVRLVRDDPAPAQQKQQPQQASVDVNGAKSALTGYYNAISNRNMRAAYNTLSDDMQNHMGTFESFSSGYQTTIASQADNIQVVSASPDRVVLSYTLTSGDRMPNKRIKVQNFSGTATMSSAAGGWHIVDMSVQKTGEHIE